ncbi:hypothetical protein [Streptomyces parvus]|uniref:hypothetical protein n=1 Tax=Streptomyces parvus TaxID=66428 RepID=UPI00210192E3|nr:hypothetical protein [Streptomyces parvus]MCQ1577752.1 hypothetical protein [Streptomyces parvus]
MDTGAARAGAGAGARVVVAGGVFWFGGGYDRRPTDRALTPACDGVLPADGIRAAARTANGCWRRSPPLRRRGMGVR